jgi:hypothetical protein
MAFKQHNNRPETIWRRKHRKQLLDAGLPDSVVDDERTWGYVLLHGDDEFGSGWNTSWITEEQASNLLRLLRSQYPSTDCYDIFPELEKRMRAAEK